MKSPILPLLLFILALSHAVLAEDMIYHTPNSDEVSQLLIDNQSYKAEDFWLIFYENSFVEEKHFEIPARSKKVIQVSDYKQKHWDMTVLTKTNLIKLPVAWSKQSSTHFEKSITGLKTLELNPINLWKKPQVITLEFFDLFGQSLKTDSVQAGPYLKSSTVHVAVPSLTAKVKIKSQGLLNFPSHDKVSYLIDNSRELSQAPKTTHYFLVSNGTNSSFIAPIQDPELVAKARTEITNFQGFMIFAEIDYNEKDPNRNLASPLKPYWSWKISEVTGLSQIGADWCQTYPEMLERMLEMFVIQKQVCFRGQRIIKELRPEDIEN